MNYMASKMVIPGELPTMNEIVAASKSHHMRYSTMKKQYTGLVAFYAKELPKYEKVDLAITWYCKNMRKDKDNIASGIKFILDGLVEAGTIKNDGWKEIGEIKHSFEVDKEKPRIEVFLWNSKA